MVLIFIGTPVFASQLAGRLIDGVKYYKEGDFSGSIKEFSRITDAGIKNGKLFYNLANAYFKNGDAGYAILWYERALKLMPNDPALRFNLTCARSFVKDEKKDEESSVFHILFFWKDLFGRSFPIWTGIILNALFWGLLTLRTITGKKILVVSGYMLFVITIIFIMTGLYNFYEAATIKKGIVLETRLPVRSGLSDDSTELFVLHAGTKVKIEKEKRDFFFISFTDGKIGWIKKSDVGII